MRVKISINPLSDIILENSMKKIHIKITKYGFTRVAHFETGNSDKRHAEQACWRVDGCSCPEGYGSVVYIVYLMQDPTVILHVNTPEQEGVLFSRKGCEGVEVHNKPLENVKGGRINCKFL
jgi:hypothetical protein